MLKNKGALGLVVEYGSDTSDDDVPGPRVSTKRTHKSDDELSDSERHYNKKDKMLPVPQVFRELSSDQHTDDPALHDDRIRSFAHVRGNWASYAYIPFENIDGVVDLVECIINKLAGKIPLKQTDDFHISLSKTVILKYHWIPTFVESIKSRIELSRKFLVIFDGLKIYCNEERTRTFIGLQIGSGYDSLLRIVEIVDKCLEEFSLATFYKECLQRGI
ncbi:unnamed protein product [Acanthoscelides obtectus]|uniref:U6 snRNA phosphodiesterase 1 n=1 Tax=Acanthoscelides obtectus TaxID=200917 RepID=A0A9P0K4R4_ACAOB|nr:unnamed protein product [Acanthoscelides obtectus]CAK1669762.1 U6 snRNA phosphodiesterase [Acanthoscelides obtectus]